MINTTAHLESNSTDKASLGTQPATGLRDAAPFIVGVMWTTFVVIYLIFYRYKALKIADFILYVGSLVVAPIAGYVAYRLAQKLILATRSRLIFETFTLTLITLSTFARSAKGLLGLIVIYSIGITIIAWLSRKSSLTNTIVSPLNKGWEWARNIVSLVLAIGFARLAASKISTYLYWPYKDAPMVSWDMDITEHTPNPGRVIATTIVILAVVYLCRFARTISARYRRFDSAAPHPWHGWKTTLWILTGVLLGYALLQPELFFNAHHYNAYIGPRHLHHMGGWPLVDVFSQYGLSYLAYLPLGTVLPFNYQSAAVITNVLDIAMMLVALCMVNRIAGDKPFALPVAAAFILVTWLVMPYNISYTPSVFGVRWLPVWILVLSLVVRPTSARLGVGALIALNVSALWSIETHLIAAIVFAFYCALASRLTGAGFGRSIINALIVLPASLIGHAIFALVTLVMQGQLPSYDIYLEIIGAYSTSENISWILLASKMISTKIWLVFVVVYAGFMFLAVASFMEGKAVLLNARRLVPLTVIAAMGVAQGVYFVGRPTQPLLALVGLPLYTILACCFIFWINHVREASGRVWRELGLLASLIIAAVLGGVATDRALMDFNSGKMGATNDSMFVKCIRFGHCNPIREIGLIADELRKKSSLLADTPGVRNQTATMVELYRKWNGKGPELVSLAAQRTTAYVELGVRDRLPINNFFNDRLSPTLMKRLSKSLGGLPVGSLIMTIDDMSGQEIGLLCELNKRFAYVQVDAKGDTRIERLVERDPRELELIGRSVEYREGKTLLPTQGSATVPVTEGLAGFVERTIFERDNASASGWAIDETGPGVPQGLVVTIRDRVWATGIPRFERPDIAALNPRFLKSGFRIFVCGVQESDLGALRAYAVLSDGTARELRYSEGVKHGRK